MRWTELRALAASRGLKLKGRLEGTVVAVWGKRSELAVFLAAAGGWAAITLAIGRLVRPDVVWPISLGLFLLSLCGWKLLYLIGTIGLYKLNAADDEGRRRRG